MNSVADALHKLACLCFWIAATFTFADDLVSDVPFVSGFDRFGRHADIDQVTAGRLLITELSCTACHAAEDALLLPKRGPVLDWPDARAEKWGNWVCGEQGNLLRSPVSIHRVFTQSEGAQQWGYHPLFVPVNTSHHCGSLPEFCCEFTSQTGRTRCAIQQTELGQLTPVSPRPKSRFMNLSATLNWAGMVLWHLSHPHSASRKIITTSRLNEKLGWLRKYRPDILRWSRC